MAKKIHPLLFSCHISRTEKELLALLMEYYLSQGPGGLFSVGQVSRWSGKGRRTVRRVMARLARRGILNRYSGGRRD